MIAVISNDLMQYGLDQRIPHFMFTIASLIQRGFLFLKLLYAVYLHICDVIRPFFLDDSPLHVLRFNTSLPRVLRFENRVQFFESHSLGLNPKEIHKHHLEGIPEYEEHVKSITNRAEGDGTDERVQEAGRPSG